MDSTEKHYIEYDPEAIWQSMVAAYVEAGGTMLYPGDEKEMLLRGVQSIVVQLFAGVDNALRMDTLRYAVGEYLDMYGEKRSCYRIPAAAAEAKVTVTIAATGHIGTIPAGSLLTADGSVLYKTKAELSVIGYAQTLDAEIVCEQKGLAGNGLTAGTVMQFLVPQEGVTSVVCSESATGGQNEETDEAYRERIRAFGLANVTTGPKEQYEAAAKAVSSVILDAAALNGGGGVVAVYLLLSDPTGAAALIAKVADALSAQNVRPLTDSVTVYQATDVEYTLNVEYETDGTTDVTAAIGEAANEYQKWQDEKIGQAFNPDRLKAALYQAGATLVTWGTGSAFDGGDVEYTTIQPNERCKGTITLTEV